MLSKQFLTAMFAVSKHVNYISPDVDLNVRITSVEWLIENVTLTKDLANYEVQFITDNIICRYYNSINGEASMTFNPL